MSEKSEIYKKAKARIVAEMTQDEQHKDFFSQYSAHSVKLFIERYAEQKANLEAYGDFTKYQERNLMDEWQTGAWDALEHIQQKKLLDTGLLWLAEEVRDLPEISLSFDFDHVSKHILDYSGIPDVNRDEIDFFIQYLRNEADEMAIYLMYASYHDISHLHQSYPKDTETGIPYYDYHNTYSGNDKLFHLPNIRREKEMEYIKLANKHQQAAQKAASSLSGKKEQKAYLSSDEEELIKFARNFGQLKTASFIADYRKWFHNQPDSSYKWAASYLKWIYPENVILKQDIPWNEALFSAAVAHKKEKICEMLPAVYEEYLMKRNTGIRISRNEDETDDLDDIFRKMILQGRILKGEPEDFNF